MDWAMENNVHGAFGEIATDKDGFPTFFRTTPYDLADPGEFAKPTQGFHFRRPPRPPIK
jgi:hypothetical protein